MHAFIRFHRGILAMPTPWKVWLALLVGVNLVVPLVLVARVEARVVIASFCVSMGLMTVMTEHFGFSRILGLGHAPWFPLLAYLMTRLPEVPVDAAFGLLLQERR